MKISAQEEYGIRCLLRLAREEPGGSLSNADISRDEQISVPYVAKLMRILRRGGFVISARGHAGGYKLSRPPEEIVIGDVLTVLGGRLYEASFCAAHAGEADSCSHHVNCAVRALWRSIQTGLDLVLTKITLNDLLTNEQAMRVKVAPLLTVVA